MLRVALTFSWLFVLAGCEAIAGIPDVRMEPPKFNEDGATPSGGCASFCERAQRLCTEEFTIYQTDACMTACALYSEDDLKCREGALDDLSKSNENDRNLYCPRASLGGGGMCGGSLCTNYCNTMSVVCADHREDNVNYPDDNPAHAEECASKCAVIPDKARSPLGPGASSYDVIADHEGDTIQCRMVHLTLATLSERLAMDHCAHAHISPQPQNNATMAPWCGGPNDPKGAPTCDDYCAVNLAACKDKFEVYDDLAQCRAACRSFDLGTSADNGPAHNVACRRYHSYNAAVYAKPELHCPHAGPGGAGVCGDDCESLCLLLEDGCPAEYEDEYNGSASSCQAACDMARKADPMYMNDGASYSIANAKQGHAFACRLYSATIATSMSNDAADVCAVAVGKTNCPFPDN
jgi:hypothetical protein